MTESVEFDVMSPGQQETIMCGKKQITLKCGRAPAEVAEGHVYIDPGATVRIPCGGKVYERYCLSSLDQAAQGDRVAYEIDPDEV
ncbi:MAG: hypothetical protein M3O70_25855 [Actinomycetota bacterium]|nr:hypothetical protein [Actinomycetota bacterium]